ncbi:MAG: cupin domain-containing protein [Nitrospira sp.]|nr:cupin domain-containing protein [Nitrospira sp.]
MTAQDTLRAQPFVVGPTNYASPLDVLGTKVTVLASNAATHSYEITLQRGDEGTGPPLHCHNWDESFFVLKGSIEFTTAGKTVLCKPGTLVHVPANTMHGFCYGVGGGEMLEFTGQGGLATQMFTAVHQEIPPGPPDIPKVLQVLAQNGVAVAP